MPRSRSPYAAAWCLWRHGARRLAHRGPVVHRAVLVPSRAEPSGARTEGVLATPPGVRGWVILPQGVGPAAFAPLGPMLHGVGLGTLSLAPWTGSAELEARTEALVEAARWFGRQPVATAGVAGRRPWLGLAGFGANAAAVLAAAASGELPIGAVVAGGGRYEGLDEARLVGPTPAARLIAARDDATGLWQAREVLGWLAAGVAKDVVVVPGTAEGFTRAGVRQARWLAGAWLLEHAVTAEASVPGMERRSPALAALRLGAALLPLGVLVPMAWLAPASGGGGAEAAPARLWAGVGSADWRGERLPVLKLDAALPGTIELSSLNGTNGFMSNGISTIDVSGYSVSGAGDVNGDSFDDILIGAFRADPNGSNSGQSYVVYGATGVPGTVELSALNGMNGFRVNGISSNDFSGQAVSGAGDVNGDSFDDILIGAPLADPNGGYSGQSYVVYGGTGLPATVELSALNGTSGFRVNGILANDFSGRAVSGAGDVNGDSFDDILIGASIADPNGSNSGQSYVVYGGTGVPATVELSALNGTNGFRVNGNLAGDFSGLSVSGAGDVNGDSFDDILIGAIRASPNGSDSGQSYVVYGGTGVPATVELSALNGTNGFRANGISAGDFSGRAVSGAGDVNGDSFDDILIGAPVAGPNGSASGQSYVVYGGTGLPGTIELSSLNGTNGFRSNGISTGDVSGYSVSGAGDVNGDSFDDILIGAHRAGPNGSASGQSHVVYGGTGVPATVELSALNGTNGFRVNGISSNDFSGYSVSGAGDVNGDSFDDILIGGPAFPLGDFHFANTIDAPLDGPNGLYSGQSYVVYGDGGILPPATPTAQAPTSAEVTGLAARVAATGGVTVAWETASEADVLGFNVYRALAEGGAWSRVNRTLLPARGSAAGGASYAVPDAPGIGTFAYRLEVVNGAGAPQTFGPVQAVVRAIRAFLPWGQR